MDEVSAILKALGALDVVRYYRDSPDLHIAEVKLSSALDVAIEQARADAKADAS